MSDWADGDLYDRIDELRAENAALRATIEARDDALMRAGRDNLRLGRIVEHVRSVAQGLDASCTEEVLAAIDGAPDPRRVETAEELDALPVGAVIRTAGVGGEIVQIDEDGDALYFGTEIFSPAKCCNLPATVLWLPEGES